MFDGIFHQRLQCKARNQKAAESIRTVNGDIQTILITELLQQQVTSDIIKLLRKKDKRAFALGQAQSEHVRERGDHFADLVLIVGNCHPVDGIQGVIEKMRIDLTLQQGKFGIFLFQIFDIIFADQSIDTGNHLLIGVVNLNDLSRLPFHVQWFFCRMRFTRRVHGKWLRCRITAVIIHVVCQIDDRT